MKMSNRAKSALASAGYSTNMDNALSQLAQFASQNSGIDARNYGIGTGQSYGKGQWKEAWSSYRSEARSISEDWRKFKAALAVAGNVGVTSDDVIAEARNAFSGRLEWKTKSTFCTHCNAVTNPDGHNTTCPKCVRQDGVRHIENGWSYCTGQYFPTEYRKAATAVLEAATRRVRQSRPPTVRMPSTIAELRYLNEQNGGCWFSRGSMKFFGTRIESEIIGGHFFITSEQPPHGPRKWTVRTLDDKGDVGTHGEFCAFDSGMKAKASLLAELQAEPKAIAA